MTIGYRTHYDMCHGIFFLHPAIANLWYFVDALFDIDYGKNLELEGRFFLRTFSNHPNMNKACELY